MPSKTNTKRTPTVPSKTKAIDLRSIVQSSDFKNFETLAVEVGCSPVTLYAAANEHRLPHQRAIRAAIVRALKLGEPKAGKGGAR